jgi:hypothetical protein
MWLTQIYTSKSRTAMAYEFDKYLDASEDLMEAQA